MPSWSESQDRLIKRRRRTTKHENAILEDLFQKVKIALCLVPHQDVFIDIDIFRRRTATHRRRTERERVQL